MDTGHLRHLENSQSPIYTSLSSLFFYFEILKFKNRGVQSVQSVQFKQFLQSQPLDTISVSSIHSMSGIKPFVSIIPHVRSLSFTTKQ